MSFSTASNSKTKTITTNYTITDSDWTIRCNSSSDITISLPAVVDYYNTASEQWQIFIIKNVNDWLVTIDTNWSEKIDDKDGVWLGKYQQIILQSNWTSWDILQYWWQSDYILVWLTTAQSTNLSDWDNIAFDTILKWNLSLSNHRITLKKHKTYRLECGLLCKYSNDQWYLAYQWYDVTNSTFFWWWGENISSYYKDWWNSFWQQVNAVGIITPSTDIEVELQIKSNVNDYCTLIFHSYSYGLIEEIWNTTSIVDSTDSSIEYGEFVLSANQSDFTSNKIEIDTRTTGNITLNSDYTINLKQWKTYKLNFKSLTNFSATTRNVYYIYRDYTNSVDIWKLWINAPMNASHEWWWTCWITHIIRPTSDIKVWIKISWTNSANFIYKAYSTLDVIEVSNEATMTDTLTLQETAWDSDHTVSWIQVEMTVGESVVFGDCLYMKNDWKLWKSDADSSSTMPIIAMATETTSADWDCMVLLNWIVRDDTYNWTIWWKLYASETAWWLTQTAPSDEDDIIQVIGVATTADRIYFNPSLDTITHDA